MSKILCGGTSNRESDDDYAKVLAIFEPVRRRMIWNTRGDFGAEVIGSSGLGYAALR